MSTNSGPLRMKKRKSQLEEEIIITTATVFDLEELSVLFDQYRQFYRQETDLTAARKFMLERLSSNDSKLFIALKSGTGIIGFTQLYPLFSSVRMKKLWLLNDLFIVPVFRGIGISKLLLDRCKLFARESNAAGLILETEKSNHIGNQLYPKCDFKINTISNFYYWDC